MADPNEKLKEAIETSLEILTDYIEPGERNCESTVNKLTKALDNDEVKEAIEESDGAKASAREVALDQKDPAVREDVKGQLAQKDRPRKKEAS
jgi:hypothetical protein